MKRLFLFAFLPLLFSCSSDTLSSKEAQVIIEPLYPQYCYVKTLARSYEKTPSGGFQAYGRKIAPVMGDLNGQGLITLTSNTDRYGYIKYTMTPSIMARDLSLAKGNTIAITQSNFVEVIDISQSENEAIVRIKVNRKATPFYKLRKLHRFFIGEKRTECIPEEFEKDIVLVKFDKGWRVK